MATVKSVTANARNVSFETLQRLICIINSVDKVRKIMEKETNLKEMVRLSPEVIVYLL